ncbi:MAG TPA: enoyl-CoA hydratase/isomerase family protein [Candidatus Polarisedimenticolia bacterium]|nr:enoyl-CoA hydratase/isomerase family protein [Candidatus Polarisedimenticolia bacterium]
MDPIRHERAGRTGYVTINRPPLNILTIAAMDRLAAAIIDLTERDPVDVMVIRAAGDRAFSAGADVAEHLPELAPVMLSSFHRVARLLWSTETVSVAAVKGLALGGGMELALCCDLVVASENAEFGQPEIHVGSFPPIASVILPQRVGRQVAADIVLTGRRLSGFEALALGLVSRLASPGAFEEELGSVIGALERNSGPITRHAVRALRAGRAEEFTRALDASEAIYRDLLVLADAREGVEAFLQKRKPRWQSRPKETPER